MNIKIKNLIFRQRIPKRNVFYYKSPAHHGHYVLSIAFAFDKEDEIFQFALAPPYSYSRLQMYLRLLEQKASHLQESFKRELLANSIVRLYRIFYFPDIINNVLAK